MLRAKPLPGPFLMRYKHSKFGTSDEADQPYSSPNLTQYEHELTKNLDTAHINFAYKSNIQWLKYQFHGGHTFQDLINMKKGICFTI